MPWMMWKPLPSGSRVGSSRVHTRVCWYSCSSGQRTPSAQIWGSYQMTRKMPTTPMSTGGTISFHGRPAKKITDSPAAITSSEVPRSGCFMISPTGTISSAKAITKSVARNCPSRRWNHQASISGVAILSISEGWMTTPTLTQRCAPFLVMPNRATATSRATPTV
ncbi:hypothetical protein SDC9_194389 [bioreactor metagenome]|uniref:Uncharacterized protein n=1 Tax=bioreactor metagenome TaxID=1076179 RepID=A0A645I6R5_9ZZZZ